MKFKGLNESFKKILNEEKLPEAKSNKENLKTALELRAMNMMDKRIANLKQYEIAFQEVIESMFPDHSWWEVTDCNIFMSLFNDRDVYKTIDEIVDGFKLDETIEECDKSLEEDVNLANKEINDIIYNSMRSKTFARKHLNDLAKYGIKVNLDTNGQGTELIGPNGKKLWAWERATFAGPQNPGFDKTHDKPYLYSSDYDKKSLEGNEKELDYLNKLDDYGLAREYSKAKTLDDAKAFRDADIKRITDRIEYLKQNIKDDKKHDDEAIRQNREKKTRIHNNPYKDYGRIDSSESNKVDFLTYLTKDVIDDKTKEDIRKLGLKTDTMRDYDNLKREIGHAKWNLDWENKNYGVKSDDEIENEVAKYKADLIAKNEKNKANTKSAEDRLAKAKQAKSDFVKSKLNKNESLKEDLSYGEIYAISDEWEKYKKKVNKSDADTAWEFIETECKGVYDTDEEKDEVFSLISSIEEKDESLKEELFHNSNGDDYEVLARNKVGDALLKNTSPKFTQYVVAWNCPIGKGSWSQGHYFRDEETAREFWENNYALKEECSKKKTKKVVKETYKADGMEFESQKEYSDYKKEMNNYIKGVSKISDDELLKNYKEFKGSTHPDDIKVFNALETEVKKRKLTEDWEDLDYAIDDIYEEVAKKCNEVFPDANVSADDIVFDDSRGWSLYISGSKLNLPVNKFGAYRNYLGGGVRGSIDNNGREQEGTVELGDFFEEKLKEIESIINSGHEEEHTWDQPTGVLEKMDTKKSNKSLKEKWSEKELKTYDVDGVKYTFYCNASDSRTGFKHECSLFRNDNELAEAKINYYNRTWEAFTFQSVMLSAVEKAKNNASKYGIYDIKAELDKLYDLIK